MMRVALLLPALFVLPACGGDGASGRPEPRPGDRPIVLITLDTTRADMLGAYGSTAGVTPRLDELARAGVVFDNAYAPMPQTLPSHATMLTGLMPRAHGALENMYVLDDRFETMASSAGRRGYATGAFIGALAIEAATGVDNGFETFDQPRGEWNEDRKGHPPQRKAQEVTDAALAWADSLDGDRPYLLWAHYYDPHGDDNRSFKPPKRHYDAVEPAVAQREVDARRQRFGDLKPKGGLPTFWRGYLAELRYTDEQVGLLLDGLDERGLLDDAIIVVVGDHGEGLYEHGEKGHGTHLWEEMLRVPLFVVHPDGTGAGRRVAARVVLQDIEPTVKHMAMGQVQSKRHELLGVDLWAAVLSENEPPERPVFLERPHYGEERIQWRGQGRLQYGFLTAVLDGRHKLVREPDGSTTLYDLEADPDELVDISTQDPEASARLTALIEAWLVDCPSDDPGSGSQVEAGSEREEALRQLGYLGGGEDDG